jgi:hypothetical protein
MHINKKYKPPRAVLNMKAGVGGLIAGLIAILNIAAFYGTELDLPDVCGAFTSITAGGGV